MEYNIYCDESCHLRKDTSDIMILGALQCPKKFRKGICNDIRAIKKKHNLNDNFEIKWTKVGNKRIEFYLELIEYFFMQSNLDFKCLVLSNKQQFVNYLEELTDGKNYLIKEEYNLWYYKMYFILLNFFITPLNEYSIYVDIKDTRGGEKMKTLHEVLCNNNYDFKKRVINKIQLIRSDESEILQLTDLLIGAIGFYNRYSVEIESGANYNLLNAGKIKIVEKIKEFTGISLTSTTTSKENFNLLFIRADKDEIQE